jgi:hypothetical protein
MATWSPRHITLNSRREGLIREGPRTAQWPGKVAPQLDGPKTAWSCKTDRHVTNLYTRTPVERREGLQPLKSAPGPEEYLKPGKGPRSIVPA